MKKLVVLSLLFLVQVTHGALISESTLDPMANSSLWYSNTTGMTFTTAGGLNDPLDPGNKQILQRSVGNNQEVSVTYKTEGTKTFDEVDVTYVYTMYWGHYRLGLRYMSEGDTEFKAYPTTPVYGTRTLISGKVYYQVWTYNLSGLNANTIQLYMNDVENAMNYSPNLATVKMTVVPEPGSLLLLISSGLSFLFWRKK